MDTLLKDRDAKLLLVKKFIDQNLDLAPQGSEKWLKMREKIIGGSELSILINKNPFSGIPELVASKCGLFPFSGNIATNWGNIFEEMSRIIIHLLFLKNKPLSEECIFETGSLEGVIPHHRFSPDGLTVILTKNSALIALLEFKSPLSSIPSQVIPPYYLPQVKAGLCNIELTEIGLFVNSMFRKCTINQFGDNSDYNIKFHLSDIKKKINVALPLAIGMIGFYQTNEQRHQFIKNTRYNYESSDEDTDDSEKICTLEQKILNGNIDIGELDSVDTLRFFQYVLSKQITIKYFAPNIYVNRMNIPQELEYNSEPIISFKSYETNPNKFIKSLKNKCIKKTFHYVGVLPWKLFMMDLLLVEKDPLYIYQFVDKIKQVIDHVNYICTATSLDEKKDRFLSLFPNKRFII